jgi:hypothetical protein
MWLKIETHTISKPEVFAMAASLQVTRAEVVGHLVTIWAWFDQNTEDGCLKVEHGKAIIDGLTVPNFAEAMVEVNWLTATESKLCLPNFSKHNGSTAKKRANGQIRQQRFRNTSSVRTASPDKIRKDKKEETTTREATPFKKVVAAWNEYNTPKIERLTDKRKAAIRILCKEYSLEDIQKVFSEIQNIPFLIGDNERGWRADFDYTIKPDKFLKIFEGGWATNQKATNADFDEWNK